MTRGLTEKDCCRSALLISLLMTLAWQTGYKSAGTCFPRVARIIYQLLKGYSDSGIQWKMTRENFLNRRKRYEIYLPETEGMKEFLRKWGIPGGFYRSGLRKACCKRAFLKGAYIAIASIGSPSRNYHVEFVCPNPELCMYLQKVLSWAEIGSGTVRRQGHDVLYIKKADDIARLLNILGAYQSLLKFEEIRAIKETREEVRRRVNCETANLDKISRAAVRQFMNIKYLREAGILLNLPDNLKKTAELRLKYPEASLKELGEHSTPPLSKSSINSHFRQIERLCRKHRENK